MFWFPLSFPWQTLFTFFYEHSDWKQTGKDWPNSEGLCQRIRFIKGGSKWLETIYSYLRTHGLGTCSQWPPGVSWQRCIVKTELLHTLKMNLGGKVSPSLSVNTLGGKCSSCLKIAMCHQCGSPPLILRAKQAKRLRRAWMGERGHPIKSHYSLFIFVSNNKLNDRTSCNLVFLVLLWAVIIHICKNSFRVQKTDRVVGKKQQSVRIRLPSL